MRKVIIGVLLPVALAAASICYRLTWSHDIHPPQPIWWVWVLSLFFTGAGLGFGVCAYWFKGGHQQDGRK